MLRSDVGAYPGQREGRHELHGVRRRLRIHPQRDHLRDAMTPSCEWCGAVGRDVERIEVMPGRIGKGGAVIEFAVHAYACVVHREHARETWTDARVKLRRAA